MLAGHLTVEDRQFAYELLRTSGSDLIAALEKHKQTPYENLSLNGNWSAAQIGEHLILAEIELRKTIQKALLSPIRSDWQAVTAGKEKLLRSILAQGNGKAIASAALLPVENLELSTVIDRFEALRFQTIEFVKAQTGPLHAHTLPNSFFGDLSAYQWILYIGYHTRRHILQLEHLAEP